MKKTLNINLSGLIFTLDEDAYNILKNYLDGIEKHFQNEAGKEEIIADIEGRFAEEFSKKKSSSKEVMTLEDVNAVIATLGTVEDFSSEKTENTSGESVQKEMPDNQSAARRLYRDPENALLAGVASGIAKYFGVDVVWIRILFVVFTFAWGFAIPLYILLWIITPKAETAAQKAEMMGEPLTVKAIEEHVKSMVNEGKEKFNSFEKKNGAQRLGGFFRDIGRGLKNFIRKFFSIFGAIIGFFLSIGAFVGIIFLGIATGIAMVHRHSPEIGVNIFNYISPQIFFLSLIFWAGVFFFPLLAIFLLGVRLMRKRATFNGYVVSVMVVLWAGSLIGGGTMLSKVGPQIERMEQDGRVNQQGAPMTLSEEIEAFESLSLDGAYTVQILPGEKFSLTANGYEGDVKKLKFETSAKELSIYQEDDSSFCIFCSEGRIEITLTAPTSTLRSLELDGANEVFAQRIAVDTFTLDASGANKFTGNFTGVQLNVEERGANVVTLSGAADFAKFEISGASKMEAFDLQTKALFIDIDGASRANVSVQNNLEGEISGAAKVDYRGSPLTNNLEIWSAGRVLDLDPEETILPPEGTTSTQE